MNNRPFDPYFGGFRDGGVHLFAFGLVIALWIGVALVLVALLRSYRRGPHHHSFYAGRPEAGPTASTAAIDILKERFARGEMSEEEFTRRLTLLKNS